MQAQKKGNCTKNKALLDKHLKKKKERNCALKIHLKCVS